MNDTISRHWDSVETSLRGTELAGELDNGQHFGRRLVKKRKPSCATSVASCQSHSPSSRPIIPYSTVDQNQPLYCASMIRKRKLLQLEVEIGTISPKETLR